MFMEVEKNVRRCFTVFEMRVYSYLWKGFHIVKVELKLQIIYISITKEISKADQ